MPQVERGSKFFKGSRARVTKPKELTVLACLQANALNPAFGGKCKAMVAEKTKAQLSDMRADMDLFGACRWKTVRTHTQRLMKELKLLPALLPWDEESCSAAFNAMEAKKVNAARPVMLCLTITWIHKQLGGSPPQVMAPGGGARLRGSPLPGSVPVQAAPGRRGARNLYP